MKKSNPNRMRSLLTVVLTLTLPLSTVLWANPVDKKQALEKAKQFYNERGLFSKSGQLKQVQLTSDRDSKSSGTETETASYYVFTTGEGSGFVIISGDDHTLPVLGYSDSGRFNAEAMPANMRAWLDGYAMQIRRLQQYTRETASVATAVRPSAPAKASTHAVIEPLMATKWDQDAPYNNLCPVFFDEGKYGRTVTGCVATAMAQIMKYYRYPAKTTQAIPGYKCKTDWSGYIGSGSPAYINVPDVAVTTLDWNNMLNTYNGGETDAQIYAVAKLMQACGASVNMNYGISRTGGSGGDYTKVKNALVNYFDYDKSIKFVTRNDYTSAEWDALLYAEISAKRAVFYGGESTGGNHEFIVDGYDGSGYFHVNWGWGGLHDGYFLIDVFTPEDNSGIGAGEGGYNSNQHAIIGIKPNAGGDNAAEDVLSSEDIKITGNKTFTRTASNKDFSNVSVAALFYNFTGDTGTFDTGYGVYDTNDKLVSVHPFATNLTLTPNRGFDYNNSNTSFSFGANLGAGTYRIVPVSKRSQNSQWVQNKGTRAAYILAVISGNTLTLSTPATKFMVDINCTNSPEVNGPADLQIVFNNLGADFIGNYTIKEKNDLYSGHLEIKGGETLTHNVSVKPEKQGATSVTLYINDEPVAARSIQTTAPTTQTLTSAFTVTNGNASTHEISGSNFEATIEYENKGQNNYDNYVYVELWKQNANDPNSWDYITHKADRLKLAKGAKTTRSYAFKGLDDGGTYYITMCYMSGGKETYATASDPYTIRHTSGGEKTSYAVLNNGTLTIYHDDQKDNREGKKYSIRPLFSSYPGWAKDSLNIIKVRIDASYANRKPTSLQNWFSHHVNLTSIEGMENLNTSSATSMQSMFYECNSLQNVDVSKFDTHAVKDMRWMFFGCTALKSVNVKSFNTSAVTAMKSMFNRCSSLTTLDLSSFDTQNVTDMSFMFFNCSSLKNITWTNKFSTANVTDLNYMFFGCSSLESVDLSKFNTAKATLMNNMFTNCSKLTSLNLKNFNTANVTDMNRMFYGCSSLTQLNVSSFNTAKVTDMEAMFDLCENLTTLDLSSFQTPALQKLSWLCYGCKKLTELNLSGFTTGNVYAMQNAFWNCSSLKTIYASGSWATDKVESSVGMFGNCTSLVGGAGTRYNANQTDHLYARIDGGTSSPGYFTLKKAGRKGDVNNDGNVNSADVQKVYMLMAQGATSASHPEADVNGDDKVNSADVQKIYSIMAEN